MRTRAHSARACTHMRTHVLTRMLAHTRARMLACTHAHTHACTHTCTHARMHAHMHTCMHAHMHTRMHARTHAHIIVCCLQACILKLTCGMRHTRTTSTTHTCMPTPQQARAAGLHMWRHAAHPHHTTPTTHTPTHTLLQRHSAHSVCSLPQEPRIHALCHASDPRDVRSLLRTCHQLHALGAGSAALRASWLAQRRRRR